MSQLSKPSKMSVQFRHHWHYLYYSLVVFNIATICICLFYSHENLRNYKDSVRFTDHQVKTLHQIAQVSKLVQQESIIGSYIFSAEDPAFERVKFAKVSNEFDKEFKKLFELIQKAPHDESSASHKLLTKTAIQSAIDRSRQYTYQIFDILKQDKNRVPKLIVEKNNSYMDVINSLEHLHFIYEKEMSDSMVTFQATLKRKKYFEIAQGILIILLLVAGAIFGSKLSGFVVGAHSESVINDDLRAVISSATNVAFIDASGCIVDVNDNFCTISGFSRHEIIGKTISEFCSSDGSNNLLSDAILGSLKNQGSWSGDMTNSKKDGESYSLRLVISPLKTINGSVARYILVGLDVTEQKRVENQLKEAQSTAKIGSWYYNISAGSLNWSSEHYRIFEIPEPQSQDVLFQLYRERVHPEDIVTMNGFMERAIKLGEDFIFDHRVLLDGGRRIKYVQGIGRVNKDSTGKPISIIGTCQDLTESKNVEIESQTILSTMSEGMVIQGKNGEIQKYNSAALEILGLSGDQLVGRTSLHPDWHTIKEDGSPFPDEEHPAIIALKTNRPVLDTIMGLSLPSGDTKWITINAIPFNGPQENRVAVTFVDITSILKKQKEIFRLQEQNRLILQATGMGIWKYNVATQELDWDDSLYDLYELDPADFLGHYDAWESSLSDEAKSKALQELQLALEGKIIFDTTFEIKTPRGTKKQIGGRGIVIRNQAGQPVMMYGVNWDRTKEVQQEESLKQAIDFNEAIKRSAQFSIITTDLQGIITGFNKEAERILGYEASELLGKANPSLFHDPKEVEQVAKSLYVEFSEEVPLGFETFIFKARKGSFDERRWTYIGKHGQRVPVLLNVTGLYDNNNQLYGYLGIAKDLTQQVQLEESLAAERSKSIHSAKLASLGEMAAGVAHEINNPLAVIVGSLQLLERFRADEAKHNARLEVINRSAVRIEKIVKGLKKFSRSANESEFRYEDLNSIISEVLILTEAKAKRELTSISVDVDNQLRIYCDQVEIEQVLVNLVNNAIDAAKNTEARWVRIIGFEDQDVIVLQVLDSGPGINSEVEDRLFQPFFTTKNQGEGTGLGLSIAKGILDNHRATIRLNKNFSTTCFEIRFLKSLDSDQIHA